MSDPEIAFAQCREYITAALQYEGGGHTTDDVLAGIRAGRFQLWPGEQSAVVTEILQFPQRRTLLLFLAAGHLVELEAMLPGILEWGQRQGCTRASLVGRAGWARSFLRRLGWLPTAVMMETSLE